MADQTLMSGEVVDEGESEISDSEIDDEASEDDDFVLKGKAKQKAKTKGKGKGKGKGKAYVVDKRLKPTQKEATSLITSFMCISTQRHHNDLCDFINILCDPSSALHPTTSTSPPRHIIFTLTSRLDAITLQSKVLDFQRMILLLQIALCVDW
jgi:hypothetical protein